MTASLGTGAGAAISFARDVARVFHRDGRARARMEVPAFDALIGALKAHRMVAAVRLHGRKYVEFSPADPALDGVSSRLVRKQPRCELCDFALIVFDPSVRRVRLSFIQVKMERASVSDPLTRHFSADPEQWLLLGTRPSLTNSPQCGFPRELLRDALIPSMGSFLFFSSGSRGSRPQTFYSAADLLAPSSWNSPKRGRLVRVKYPRIERGFFPLHEVTYAKNLTAWLAAAHALLIGDEVYPSRSSAASSWLRRVLPIVAQGVDAAAVELINEVSEFFNRDDGGSGPGIGFESVSLPRAVVVLRGRVPVDA